ncbi:unnamed protein product [Rotaria sp. Silwood1]|nr:unnamed protein product [Rotaria sp. Silwood1]CAF3944383.1 unnamed protein product [Rotaria sp. Silwood1]CAF4894704.1 unnamed protein product [Rotaria sp. Silwood1]CAF4918057.1 unnamed protein product [Rotaria sp. Silwood1]
MCSYFDWKDDGKRFSVSLRQYSHETCVALTQPSYWKKLKEKGKMISISVKGNYVPEEFEGIIWDDDPRRLELIIESKNEQDKKALKDIDFEIYNRFIKLPRKNPYPPKRYIGCYEPTVNVCGIVYGCLYNSLPTSIFDTNRYLLGEENFKIKEIEKLCEVSITVDQSAPNLYRFLISDIQTSGNALAMTLLEGLVKQTQYQYLLTFPFYHRSAVKGDGIPTDYHKGHEPMLDEYYFNKNKADGNEQKATKQQIDDSKKNTTDNIIYDENIYQDESSDCYSN